MMIKTITVIGASGTMGSNISAIFASFGNAKVYMLDLKKPLFAIDKAVKSIRADSIRKNLIPADYSMLSSCVEESDLIFESVVENISIKKSVIKMCAPFLKKRSFFCSGTSGLSIQEMANELPLEKRKQFFGVHFFNPPYNMTLCEIIKTSYSDDTDIAFLKKYLESVLYRDIVVCNDKPAFLANRIGFYFINNALQLAEKYSKEGGIDYIDSIFGQFTGRLMPPCSTADFVGLDVHKAIVDNIFTNIKSDRDYFALPAFVEELIRMNKLGRKTGEGLYKVITDNDGKKKILVYDVLKKDYREQKNYCFPFAETMKDNIREGNYEAAFASLKDNNSQEAKICKTLLRNYIDFSIMIGKEVCENIEYIDNAMAAGFNWCPPLALSNALFNTKYKTKYDFRSFFRVGK